jgi:hypothetical protein
MGANELFADAVKASDLETVYKVELQVLGVIVGGVPSNPSVIKSWLTSRMEMGDAALEELLQETIKDRNGPMTVEEKVDALAKSSVAPSVNGFKRTPEGFLAYEGRCFKAGLKEAANSAYPGTDWPSKSTAPFISKRKGLMSTFVERVFVPEILIAMKVDGQPITEPTRVEERVKHVLTAQGPRSAINIVEVVERPTLECTIVVHDDFLAREAWAKVWTRLEDIGIGADRGRSDGAFELITWEKIS